MLRLALITAALVAVLAEPASARELVGQAESASNGIPRLVPVTADRPRHVRWARAFSMPLPTVRVHRGECPQEEGGACAGIDEIWMPDSADAFDLAHEFGEIFDEQFLDDRARAWFTPLLGFPADRPWHAPNYDLYSPGFTEPAERFADAYAHCALRTVPSSAVGYGYLPSVRTHRRVCVAIAVLGLLRTPAPTPTASGSSPSPSPMTP